MTTLVLVKFRYAVTGANQVYLSAGTLGSMPARDGRNHSRLRRPAAETDTAAGGVKRTSAHGGAACEEVR